MVNRPRILPSRTAAPGTKLNERLNPDLTQNHNLQLYPREDVRHASFRPRERVFFHKATTLEQAHSRNTKLGGLPERHLAHQSWPPIGGRGQVHPRGMSGGQNPSTRSKSWTHHWQTGLSPPLRSFAIASRRSLSIIDDLVEEEPHPPPSETMLAPHRLYC